MNGFSTKVVTADAAPLDSGKHVKFNYGMVLGVDDFSQEFAYLSARDQWIVRDLVGYGTVSGLRVWLQPSADGPRVVVEPGVAATPRGELVRVALAQCAAVNDWLLGDAQVAWLQQRGSASSTDRIDVYVTLCYRTCETDRVPIPGEPCRDETELTAPSRVADDFGLELRFAPPDQRDELEVRDFVDWLAHIPIVDDASSVTLAQFLTAIRDAARLWESPPASPIDFMFGSPPGSLRIARSDACTYFRAAYRVWVTELMPRWNASWSAAQMRCSDQRPAQPARAEGCLLLARLDVPIVRVARPQGTAWRTSSTLEITIDEEARPFLVPVRMLQEFLWCACHAEAAADAPAVLNEQPIRPFGLRIGGQPVAGGAGGIAAAGSVVIGSAASGPFRLRAFVPRNPAPAARSGEFKLSFAGYSDPTGARFDYALAFTPKPGAIANPRVDFVGYEADGIRLRFVSGTKPAPTNTLAGNEFMVQVTRVDR
jgi:hypothetical protein